MEPRRFRKGRDYEALEKSEWLTLEGDCEASFEKSVPLPSGRCGRIDVLIDTRDGSLTIIEIKSTDWDKIKQHRIRPNALRHIRQVIGYLMHFHERGRDVCLAVCYPSAPSSSRRRRAIEDIFDEKRVQVVWTDERRG